MDEPRRARPVWRSFALVSALSAAYLLALNWAASGVGPIALMQIQAFVLGWKALAVPILFLGMLLAITVLGLRWLASEAMLRNAWWKGGTLYGIAVYAALFGGLSFAFGRPFPDPDRVRTALGLAPCIVLIGWPLALAARGRLFNQARGFF